VSSKFNHSIRPAFAALVAVIGLNACSSAPRDDQSVMPGDEGSVSEIQVGESDYSAAVKGSSDHFSGGAYRKSVRPVVHSVPVKNGDHWLNAFYFITSESETWQSLATKFYNRPEHADMLRQWNGHDHLAVGTVVYYNSPFRPQDRDQMLSFAEDFGQRNEAYQVVAGDSLSLIASRLWGNVHAWPAIAAINPQLAHPDLIQIGETLYLPPTVDTQSVLAKMVNDPLSLQGSGMDDSLPQLDQPAQAPVAATIDAPPPPPSTRTPMRSSTLVALAGAILVLASLVYMFWRRAQTQSQDPYAGDSLSKMDKLTSFFKTKSGF